MDFFPDRPVATNRVVETHVPSSRSGLVDMGSIRHGESPVFYDVLHVTDRRKIAQDNSRT